MINKSVILLCVYFSVVGSAQSALIPYYKMDSLALLSDVIVLCDEKNITYSNIQHDRWTETVTIVDCAPNRIFKGNLDLKSRFKIKYEADYRRCLPLDGETPKLPVGRALLFLKKDSSNDSFTVITAKLIQGTKVYKFGQFQGNPGPLVLALQRPENIQLADHKKYDEKQLIADLLEAIKKSSSLKEAIYSDSLHEIETYPTFPAEERPLP